MKKILYLMGIDWYWIKQRPQIIAEMLDRDYDVTVAYYKEVVVKQSLRKNNDELEKSIPISAIPYRDKNIIAHFIQKILFQKVMKNVEQYDIVWISHPLLYRYLPGNYKGKIVYDCMDNHEALCSDENICQVIKKTEQQLVNRADIVFASSSGLLQKVQKLGGEGKSVLLRNGSVSEHIYPPEPVRHKNKEAYKIGYFGTIAEWFDFPLLLKSLDLYPDLEYYLWGPVSNVEVPQHPRIKMQGVVEHSKLWENVKDMDALIMPFKVNDIIRDVDPVKLYEYISMGKNVITVAYDEVLRFAPFVFFYKNAEEYENIIIKLYEDEVNCKYDSISQKEFLDDNSWEKRWEIIKEIM